MCNLLYLVVTHPLIINFHEFFSSPLLLCTHPELEAPWPTYQFLSSHNNSCSSCEASETPATCSALHLHHLSLILLPPVSGHYCLHFMNEETEVKSEWLILKVSALKFQPKELYLYVLQCVTLSLLQDSGRKYYLLYETFLFFPPPSTTAYLITVYKSCLSV